MTTIDITVLCMTVINTMVTAIVAKSDVNQFEGMKALRAKCDGSLCNGVMALYTMCDDNRYNV